MIVGSIQQTILSIVKVYGKVYARKLLEDVKTPFSATRRVYTGCYVKKCMERKLRRNTVKECKALLTCKN